jgi:hypothetical protein
VKTLSVIAKITNSSFKEEGKCLLKNEILKESFTIFYRIFFNFTKNCVKSGKILNPKKKLENFFFMKKQKTYQKRKKTGFLNSYVKNGNFA